MRTLDSAPIILQEKYKKYENAQQRDAAALRSFLRSDTLHGKTVVGRALRVLIKRLKHPERPYSSLDLEILLLISLAEKEIETREAQ